MLHNATAETADTAALTGTLDTEAEVELGTPGVWDNIARRAWARDRGYLVIFGY